MALSYHKSESQPLFNKTKFIKKFYIFLNKKIRRLAVFILKVLGLIKGPNFSFRT